MKKIFFYSTVFFVLLSSPCLAGEWNLTGSLSQGRECFCSVILDDGRVLVAGGYNSGELSSCEIYNPNTSQWSTTDSMSFARAGFSLTKLSNGMVLAIGGFGYDTAGISAEIFNPETEIWNGPITLNHSRWKHCAILLQNGKVLIVGGDTDNNYQGCELYDPDTEIFTLTDFCSYPKIDHTIELLPDGQVMAIGGGNSSYEHCEIYDPNTEIWTEIDELNEPRYNHTSHLLPNGDVMAIAGRHGNHYNNSCEIYNFQTQQWTFTDSLGIGRTNHSSVVLLNGQILVVGGLPGTASLSCEIFSNGEWQTGPALTYSMGQGESVILSDERVLGIGQYYNQIYTWNYMPIAQLQGPTSGIIGEELTFSVVASDPDGDSISVRFNWGDGEISQWSNLVASGTTLTFSHSWGEEANYNVSAQVRDQWHLLNPECHNSISNWSQPLIVTINGIPEISVSVDSLNFGTVYIGQDSLITIMVSNMGNGTLTVDAYTNTNEFSVYPENFNLEPEETLEVEVTFNPSYEGIIIDALVILSNDPQSLEIQIELVGEGTVLVGEDENELIPTEIELFNYPNPFNPSTTIEFQLKTEITENTELSIYNLKGQKVRTFSNLPITQSLNQHIVWNGTNQNNQLVGSGLYFYSLIIDGEPVQTRKMILMK